MSKFLLTAQLQLQAPTNTRQVLSQMRKELSGVKVPVEVKGAAEAKRQLEKVSKSAKGASDAAQNMGRSFGLAFKRFAAFTVASRAVSLFTNGLANAVDEAIDFQREMVKISQVTRKSVKDLKSLENTITGLSVALGVSSKELLQVTRILAQTGLQAQSLEVALKALAKTQLAPTFDDITKTAEGAVAIMAQFGQGVGKLEQQLGAINAVAGQFAVESGDLIGAIRRTGGVFVEAGGSLEEFLGLFTSIRATTRESAESIATGMRTIFTRIQRPRTIEFLKQFGVELTDAEGKFVGAFEAVRRLNKAIGSLDQGDITFVRIAEEIAGFRQIGKVIPLLKEFELAEKARQSALEGGDSLTRDAATAQQSLAIQIMKVKQEFDALIRSIANTTAFQTFVKSGLKLASALIKIGEAIKPIIPLLGALAAFKFAKGLGGFAKGFGSSMRGLQSFDPTKKSAGGVMAFSRGGFVPGAGNRDTIPAMLQPGEFVIRKQSASKLGSSTLHAMNGYAAGGKVVSGRHGYGVKMGSMGPKTVRSVLGLKRGSPEWNALDGRSKGYDPKQAAALEKKAIEKSKANKVAALQTKYPGGAFQTIPGAIGGFFLNPDKGREGGYKSTKDIPFQLGGQDAALVAGSTVKEFMPHRSDLAANQKVSGFVDRAAKRGLIAGVKNASPKINKFLDVGGKIDVNQQNIRNGAAALARDKQVVNTVGGYLFEGIIQGVTGAKLAGGRESFDFPDVQSSRNKLSRLFTANPMAMMGLQKGDAKRTRNTANMISIMDKVRQDIQGGDMRGVKRLASGGGVSDTIPALLTPGEFVVNRRSAKQIGYSNLRSMNRTGVRKYAKGGVVGFNKGGEASGGGGMRDMGLLMAMPALEAAMSGLTTEADGTKNALGRVMSVLTQFSTAAISVKMAVEAFGFSVTKSGLKEFFGTGPKGLGGVMKGAFASIKAGLGGGKFVGKNKQLHMGGGFADVAKMAPGMNLKGDGAFTGKTAEVFKSLTNATHALKGGVSSAFDATRKLIPATVANTIALKANTISQALGFKSFGQMGKSFKGFGKNFKKGFTGKAGATRMGTKGAKLGSMVSKIPGASKLPALFSRLKGFAGTAVKAISKFAGPVALAAIGLGLFSKGLTALFDETTKYEKAIREGNVAEAQRSNIAKRQSGITQGLSKITSLVGVDLNRWSQGLKSMFGGDSLAKLDAQAEVAALSSQIEKEKAQNARDASEALLELKRGTMSARDAMPALTKTFKATAAKVKAQEKQAAATRGEKSGFLGSLGRGLLRVGTLGIAGMAGVESGSQRNERLESEAEGIDEQSKEEREANFEQLRSSITPLSKKFILGGESFDEFLDATGVASSLTEEQTKKLKSDYEAQQKAIKENINFIKALNFGLRDAAGSAKAMQIAMDRSAQLGEKGFNNFESSANILEAAMTSAGKNISESDMDAAIGNLEQSLKDFGATDEQIGGATGTIRGIKQAQSNTDDALDATKKALIEGGADTSDAAIKDALGKELLKGVEGPAKERLQAAIDKLEIDEEVRSQIRAGDLSGIVSKTLDPVAKAVSEDAINLQKQRAAVEGKLIKAIDNRRQAEERFIDAQKRAIDTQLEAAKLFEEFGGAKLGGDQKLAARRTQANLALENAGVGGMTGGGVGDIRRAFASVGGRFNAQQSAASRGVQTGVAAFGGASGADADRRAELKRANEALMEFTKQRIGLLKEEIEIVKKKNEAEKKSLESLLSGDIEGFLQGQAAAAAGSALRIGDAGVAGAFGASALGAGFGTLEGQGLSGAQMERAAGLSLGSMGVTDPRAAKVLAGTTAEEEALNREGRELSRVLGEGAQQGADLTKMEVKAAEVVVNAQRLNMAAGATGMALGGMVYANRGMFIPRGTDTVPAMLTPGEFVVNRAAVNRGNNLAVLQAMNGGAMGMAAGGMVKYMANGGFLSKVMGGMGQGMMQAMNPMNALGGLTKDIVAPLKDVFTGDISRTLESFTGGFKESVEKLTGMKLDLKVDPTNVNVNFSGGSFLEMMRDDVINSIMAQVQGALGDVKFNEAGEAKQKKSGLG